LGKPIRRGEPGRTGTDHPHGDGHCSS
jgi:hypothetical protein